MLKKMILSGVAFLSLNTPGFSQDSAAIKKLIQEMVGCFRVTFNYVEDGSHDAFYQPVHELAELTQEEPLTITRHLVIDGTKQKHWSEIWQEVSPLLWQQEVIGPFGDFRYSCEGTWQLNQWRCEAPKSPKPRRDLARPYAYLNRENTLQVNALRWVHVQNNHKMLSDDSLYSVESGWYVYERVENQACVVP